MGKVFQPVSGQTYYSDSQGVTTRPFLFSVNCIRCTLTSQGKMGFRQAALRLYLFNDKQRLMRYT